VNKLSTKHTRLQRKNAIFVRALRVEKPDGKAGIEFPFCIPGLHSLERMEFNKPVTFFVGENGFGKSTLLEAIAKKLRLNPEGGSRNLQFSTQDTHSRLGDFVSLERAGHFTDSYFLRAESFYNVATEMESVESLNPRKPFGAYGGKSLHAQSHGESFLALLANRLQGDGVYLFDEPEAALSPQRQLSVLTLIHRLVHHRSQLIIATHSPILLAYPDAVIFEFSEHGIRPVNYTETEHYQITKDFLNRHERMLDILLGEEDRDLFSKRR